MITRYYEPAIARMEPPRWETGFGTPILYYRVPPSVELSNGKDYLIEVDTVYMESIIENTLLELSPIMTQVGDKIVMKLDNGTVHYQVIPHERSHIFTNGFTRVRLIGVEKP